MPKNHIVISATIQPTVLHWNALKKAHCIDLINRWKANRSSIRFLIRVVRWEFLIIILREIRFAYRKAPHKNGSWWLGRFGKKIRLIGLWNQVDNILSTRFIARYRYASVCIQRIAYVFQLNNLNTIVTKRFHEVTSAESETQTACNRRKETELKLIPNFDYEVHKKRIAGQMISWWQFRFCLFIKLSNIPCIFRTPHKLFWEKK